MVTSFLKPVSRKHTTQTVNSESKVPFRLQKAAIRRMTYVILPTDCSNVEFDKCGPKTGSRNYSKARYKFFVLPTDIPSSIPFTALIFNPKYS